MSALVVSLAALASCGRLHDPGSGTSVDYNAQAANAAGDQLAGLDEGASGSGLALREPPRPLPAPWKHDLKSLFSLPSAYAANCTLAGSWTCSTTVASGAPAGTMSALTGDFSGGCTSGDITLTGTTDIDFSTSNCHIPMNGDWLVRYPNYTFTADGYSLTVSSGAAGGQRLTRTGSSAFDYDVLGVERVGKDPNGKTLFDIATTTGSAIQVTGLTRAGRTVNGGSLVVEHKLANFTSTLVPNNLTWSSGCNCPTSGSLTATNAGSRANSFTVTMESTCGSATITGTEADGGTLNTSLQLEHCHAL